jgi:hypothetical protein
MSKHTPGPWEAVEFIEGHVAYFIREKASGQVVASVGNFDGDGSDRESDAMLVAAAPDLLAACEAVLTNLDYLAETWGQEGVTRTVQDKLRAALVKATGDTP